MTRRKKNPSEIRTFLRYINGALYSVTFVVYVFKIPIDRKLQTNILFSRNLTYCITLIFCYQRKENKFTNLSRKYQSNHWMEKRS